MKSRLRHLAPAGLLALLTAGVPVSALDPDRALHQYKLDVWQPEDGLPQGSIIAIVQTADGYLWLGGYEGLTRFDGVSFTHFNRSNTPALGDNNVFDLAVATDGSLWLGTDGGGMTRYEDGRFTTWTTADGLVNDHVIYLTADPEDGVWAGTDGGLSRFRDGTFLNLTVDDGLPAEEVTTMAFDGAGDLWIGTFAGLARWRDGRITAADAPLADQAVTSVGADRAGVLWVATGDGRLWRRDPGRFLAVGEGMLPGGSGMRITGDRDGNLWVGTHGAGLLRIQDQRVDVLGDADGLSSDLVWAVTEDHEGSLWLGTEGGGLARLKDTPLTTLTARDGLPGERILVVYQDLEGRLWLGTEGAGLVQVRDGAFTVYTEREGLADDSVGSIVQGRDGTLWIGTSIGLSALRSGKLAPGPPALSAVAIDALAEDRHGGLWAGTYGQGLARVEGDDVRWWRQRDGLPHDRVRAIAETDDGGLWVGTDGGLVRFEAGDGGAPYRMTATHLSGEFVRAIHEDHEGVLWIGTRGNGLVRLADGEVTTYTTRDGLFNDVIYQILDDGENFWMSCNRGLFRVAKAQLAAFARGEIDAVHSWSYGAADGMKSVETGGGQQPAGWRTRDGRLWFPTVKGVVIVDPRELEPNRQPPPVHVERLVAGEIELDRHGLDAPVTLPPGRGELELQYTALSFLDPDKVRFKFRLEGYDDDWIDAGTRRSAYYTNLSPGSYRFRVIAANDDGVWNETGDAVDLYLRPAFYQTWVFYVACALAAAIGIRGLYDLRMRRLLRHNAELRRIQRELEAKNAEVEATSAEMQRFTYAVSHDLRSPLITIKGFLRFVETEIARGETEKAAADLRQMKKAAIQMEKMLDELLELSRAGQVVRTKEAVDLGELAREAVELVAGRLEARGVEVVIAADLPVVVGDRPRLLQALQNLLDNAVKFMGSQPEPRIEIGCRDGERGEKICHVRDNGSGIAAAHLEKIFDLFDQVDARAEGTGMGLTLVQRVIEVHGGRVWVESEGEGRGSTFYFTLPTPPSRERRRE